MYENLNKNSIIDVASTLINEMNSYTPEQQNQLLVEYIIIPFFVFLRSKYEKKDVNLC